MRDLGNLSLARVIDHMRGRVGARDATASFAGIRETRRCVETAQQIGENREVLDGEPETDSRTALRQREEELTAELEAIRERRGGGT